MKCKHCEGSGLKLDNVKVGVQMASLRKKAGIGMRALADVMNISHSYACLLEQGERNWRPSLMDRYVEAVMVWDAMNNQSKKQ